jgi:hypothetical protein
VECGKKIDLFCSLSATQTMLQRANSLALLTNAYIHNVASFFMQACKFIQPIGYWFAVEWGTAADYARVQT